MKNQKPKSLIVLRTVYDAVQMAGGVENVKITQQIISKFRNARKEYLDALEKQTDKEKKKRKRKPKEKANIRQSARIKRKETEDSMGKAKRTVRC